MKFNIITRKQAEPFIMNKHYAQRMPSISWAFGIFVHKELVGVCTFGKPASPFLCAGICGKEHSSKVYELNRLVVNEGLPKNTLSQFVGFCLRYLKSNDLIIVSFADDGKGHHGYIYQATNWLYTGKTKERTDKYMPGNKHSRHYTDEYKHIRKFRTAKHRYVFFTGRSRKTLSSALKYDSLPYPKGDNDRYILGQKLKDKMINTENNEIFYE